MFNVAVIGGGFAGLSAACHLANMGCKVTLFEKNSSIGGRASVYEESGFRFDMGPSFYWMPDIFEKFFKDLGKDINDYYKTVRLDPGYRVVLPNGEIVDMSANLESLCKTFEERERGSGEFLKKFIRKGGYNYRVAIDKVIYKPGLSPFEVIMPQTAIRVSQFVRSISQGVASGIKDSGLRRILEFPVLFLGAKPQKTPLFYNFMNYADISLGTWHIEGGFGAVAMAMERLAIEFNVDIKKDSTVNKIEVKNSKANYIKLDSGETFETDAVVAACDYHHAESLLEPSHRVYDNDYWQSRVMSPSAIMFFIGFDTTINKVEHHTLFFDTDFERHASAIYDNPSWPQKPLFYCSFTSKSDPSCAPAGCENMVVLIPVAPGIKDTEAQREEYFAHVIDRLEKFTGQKLANRVIVKKTYGISDFSKDFNSFKGNAYGMANTLFQTAYFRPSIKSKKVKNLFFAGQLTVPGPGVPPALISGQIASDLLIKSLTKKRIK